MALAWNERRLQNERERKRCFEEWEKQRSEGVASADGEVAASPKGEGLVARLGLPRFLSTAAVQENQEGDLEAGPDMLLDNERHAPNGTSAARTGQGTIQKSPGTKLTPKKRSKDSGNVRGISLKAGGDRIQGRGIPSTRLNDRRDAPNQMQDNMSNSGRNSSQGPQYSNGAGIIASYTEPQHTLGPRYDGHPRRPLTDSQGRLKEFNANGMVSTTSPSIQPKHNNVSSQIRNHSQIHTELYHKSQYSLDVQAIYLQNFGVQ